MSSQCEEIVESRWFASLVTVVVFVAAVQVGLETSTRFVLKHGELLGTLDLVVGVAFSIEIFVRFLADGDRPVDFLRRPLNLFDTLLVVGSWIPFTAGFFSVLRIVRLLRVFRLVRTMPKLQLLVATTMNSVPSILSISVLIGLLFYTYAVAGVFLFGANDPIHFHDLGTSLVSMFRVVTLEDWTDIMYTQIHGCAGYGYDEIPELCTASYAFGPFGAAFFISFVFIGTWVVLNLFIGIILAGMDEARREIEANPLAPGKTLYLLRQLRKRNDTGEVPVVTPGADVGAGRQPFAQSVLVDGHPASRASWADEGLIDALAAIEREVHHLRERVAERPVYVVRDQRGANAGGTNAGGNVDPEGRRSVVRHVAARGGS